MRDYTYKIVHTHISTCSSWVNLVFTYIREYIDLIQFFNLMLFLCCYIYTCGAVHTHWHEVNPSSNGLEIISNIVSCIIQDVQFIWQPSAHTVVCLIQDGHFQPQHTMWTVLFRTDCKQSGLNDILITQQLLLASPRKSSCMISVDGSNKPKTPIIKSRRQPLQDLPEAVHTVWKGQVNVTKTSLISS